MCPPSRNPLAAQQGSQPPAVKTLADIYRQFRATLGFTRDDPPAQPPTMTVDDMLRERVAREAALMAQQAGEAIQREMLARKALLARASGATHPGLSSATVSNAGAFGSGYSGYGVGWSSSSSTSSPSPPQRYEAPADAHVGTKAEVECGGVTYHYIDGVLVSKGDPEPGSEDRAAQVLDEQSALNQRSMGGVSFDALARAFAGPASAIAEARGRADTSGVVARVAALSRAVDDAEE